MGDWADAEEFFSEPEEGHDNSDLQSLDGEECKMAKIYMVKEGSDYGPFFTSEEKATAYLRKVGVSAMDLEEILDDEHSYISIEKIELDDEDVCFEG